MEISAEVIWGGVSAVTTAGAGIIAKVAHSWVGKARAKERAEAEARAKENEDRAMERLREREDRHAERDLCEERNKAMAAEIREVRNAYNADVVKELRNSSVAISEAASAQREGNAVLTRMCRRLGEMSDPDDTPLSNPKG